MSRSAKGASTTIRASQAASSVLAALEDDLVRSGTGVLGTDLFEPLCPRDGTELVTDHDGLEAHCACGYRRRLHGTATKTDIVALGLDALLIRQRGNKKGKR